MQLCEKSFESAYDLGNYASVFITDHVFIILREELYMQEKKIKVGIVGISFGMEFVPIYQRHPNVESVAVADYNRSLLATCAEKFHIPAEELLHQSGCDMLKADCDAVRCPYCARLQRATLPSFGSKLCNARKTLRMYDSYGREVLTPIIRSDRSAKEKRERDCTVLGNERLWQRILLCTGIIIRRAS